MTAVWVETTELPLRDLAEFPGNPRTGSTTDIRASLRRNGQYRSLIVRRTPAGFVVLTGNHTADALRAEGHSVARCEVVECSDTDAVRINLADNRIADLGGYDTALLLTQLCDLGEDLDATGYSMDDVEDLLAAAGQVPEVEGQPTGARWAETPDELAERADRIGGFASRAGGGLVDVVMVMTLAEREEYVQLIRAVRRRDGDQPAAEIVIAALTAGATPE